MSNSNRTGRSLGLLALLLAGACTDQSPLLPKPEGEDASLAKLTCTVDVRSAAMQCVTADPAQSRFGLSLDKTIGDQERLVRLANNDNEYNSTTQIFSTDVTVQNLMRSALGTDGNTTPGVKVFFFTGPAVTSGSGTVSVRNADGIGSFGGLDQPYFLYSEVLDPFEISAERTWQFDVPNTVVSFTFQVYVYAPLTDESSLASTQWTGATSTDWFLGTNWNPDSVPDASTFVNIPVPSRVTGGRQPTLTADAAVAGLGVGAGSTLNLGGFTLTSSGYVDAPGTITGGRLDLTGTNVMLGGNVSAVRITGSTSLQRPVKASGAVSVQDGSLTVAGQALSIQIP